MTKHRVPPAFQGIADDILKCVRGRYLIKKLAENIFGVIELRGFSLACLVAASLVLMVVLPGIGVASDASGDQNTFSDLISELMSNPKFYASTLIQFLMGFLLGYFSFKIIKYVIALLITLVVGSFLSVWSLGDSLNTLLSKLFPEIVNAIPYITTALQVLGVVIVGPIATGFIIGAIIGFLRR